MESWIQKLINIPQQEAAGNRSTTPSIFTEESLRAEGAILTYQEINEATEAPTGRIASLSGIEFEPLQYSDLIHLKRDKVSIPLKWNNARVIESTIPGLTVDHFASGNCTLESHFSSKTFGLLKGGWLPSGLVRHGDIVVMPDRCTISELFNRFCNGKKDGKPKGDFIDFFKNQRIRINPLLFALEGNHRRNPTPDEVEMQFEEACIKIQSALPKADIVHAGKESLRGIVGIINDTQASMERKQQFLMRIAPKFHRSISAERLPAIWDSVLSAADQCGVARRSMVVLAALSAAAVPNGRSPAKKLLKLNELKYSKELAYNALADLRSLEILIYQFALFPSERTVLCTGDKDLALFWAGVRASDYAWQDECIQFKLSPVDGLLPAAARERFSSYFDE